MSINSESSMRNVKAKSWGETQKTYDYNVSKEGLSDGVNGGLTIFKPKLPAHSSADGL